MSAGCITVYPDTPESYTVELEAGQLLEIGRKPTSTGNRKLIIPVPEVSGQHCVIRPTPAGWTIRDAGSTNGTKLNGDRLSPGKEYLLCSGDRVLVAHIELAVDLAEGVAPPAVEETSDSQDHTHVRINLLNATILVGDMRAFTSLTEKYADKPEVVMQATQLVFACLKEEISKHHGQLEKIAGDAIMAYWEADDTSTIHAFQACFTALRLQALVKALASRPDYWPFLDHPLELDLALATGPVAAGSLSGSEATPAILGDTANVAFRLEKLISPEHRGDIIVDETTYNLTSDHFAYELMGSFNIKGRLREVEAYRLLGKKDTV
jgi:class 3 adenylate cyclase